MECDYRIDGTCAIGAASCDSCPIEYEAAGMESSAKVVVWCIIICALVLIGAVAWGLTC